MIIIIYNGYVELDDIASSLDEQKDQLDRIKEHSNQFRKEKKNEIIRTADESKSSLNKIHNSY